MKKRSSDNTVCVFSLKTLAGMMEIPGGADAMERLLLAAGFLTGANRSIHSHLPYQRYLDLGYFQVIDRESPSKFKPYTFCITSKGLEPVMKVLAAFGIKMTYPDDL